MKRLLVDTQILIWAGQDSPRLPRRAAALLRDADERSFSPLSIAEIAVKRAKGRPDFSFEPDRVRRGLLAAGYGELPLSSNHAVRLMDLPPIHKDPFDRLLVAQAMAENLMLLTADATLGRYGPRVLVI